ncbi:MAG: recombination regulator RecX [Lachnospiraceae bacterium]|nr:recombination regulator RecX [Lachnospiraceae bacterium]
MLVTKIEEADSRRVKVFLDGEYAFPLYRSELSSYGIKEGEQITEPQYQTLFDEVLQKRVRLRAMNLLTKRPYTEAGLRQKLRDSLYPPVLVENGIAYVSRFGYLNDENYLRDYVESLSGKYSTRVIRNKLLQKGISQELIDTYFANLQDDLQKEEGELLDALIQKRCKGALPADPKDMAKLMRYLAGKGFSQGDIRKAIRKLESEA